MKNIFRFLIAVVLPVILSVSCGSDGSGSGKEDKEPLLAVACPDGEVVFEKGETEAWGMICKYVDEASVKVTAPVGWTVTTDLASLIVTAPSAFTVDTEFQGNVSIWYRGLNGKEDTFSIPVKVNVIPACNFELDVTDITAVSCAIKVVPEDPTVKYHFNLVPASIYDEYGGDIAEIFRVGLQQTIMAHPELPEHIIIDLLTLKGPVETESEGLEPSTDYYLYAVAIDHDAEPYGVPAIMKFRTDDPGDPMACTFDFEIKAVQGSSVTVAVTPSDPSISYWFEIYEAATWPGDQAITVKVKESLAKYAEEEQGRTLEELISDFNILLRGNFEDTFDYLSPSTAYYVYAYPMDVHGNPTGNVSKMIVKTADRDVSYADFSMSCRYFDAVELYEVHPELFPDGKPAGGVLMDFFVVPNEMTASWYFGLMNGDYTDTVNYEEENLVRSLLSVGKQNITRWQVMIDGYNTECTFVGFAVDYNTVLGPMHRTWLYPTEDKRSPVSDFDKTATMAFDPDVMSYDPAERSSERLLHRVPSLAARR